MELRVQVANGEISRSLEVDDVNQNATGVLEKANIWGVLIFGSLAGLLIYDSDWLWGTLCLVMALAGCAVIVLRKNLKPTLSLIYELDETAAKEYAKIQSAFSSERRPDRVSVLTDREQVKDTKYTGGATAVVQTKPIRMGFGLPYYLKSELSVPKIGDLCFLPDRILLKDKEHQWKDLELSLANSKFQEAEGVPNDATVIGKTWQYVNRKGGKDKRFKDNREIPICLYDMLEVKLGRETILRLMLSKEGSAKPIALALLDWRNTQVANWGGSSSPSPLPLASMAATPPNGDQPFDKAFDHLFADDVPQETKEALGEQLRELLAADAMRKKRLRGD